MTIYEKLKNEMSGQDRYNMIINHSISNKFYESASSQKSQDNVAISIQKELIKYCKNQNLELIVFGYFDGKMQERVL